MGRGVSAGGGQSSLGYLFGSGETPKPAEEHGAAAPQKQLPVSTNNDGPPQNSTASASSQPAIDVVTKEIPAGIQGSQANNYFRADEQNCGNFITDRPSTKVHAAPGGGSSLGYLFGSGGGS